MPAEQRMPPCIERPRIGIASDYCFDDAARSDQRTDDCAKQAPAGRLRSLGEKAPRRLITALRVLDSECEPRACKVGCRRNVTVGSHDYVSPVQRSVSKNGGRGYWDRQRDRTFDRIAPC